MTEPVLRSDDPAFSKGIVEELHRLIREEDLPDRCNLAAEARSWSFRHRPYFTDEIIDLIFRLVVATERRTHGCTSCGRKQNIELRLSPNFALCERCLGYVAERLPRIVQREIVERYRAAQWHRSVPEMRILEAPHHVYVLAHDYDGGRTKIGIAENVAKRMKGIEAAAGVNVSLVQAWELPTQRDAAGVEKLAHKWLAQQRTIGEWFSCLPAVAVGAVEGAIANYIEDARPFDLRV